MDYYRLGLGNCNRSLPVVIPEAPLYSELRVALKNYLIWANYLIQASLSLFFAPPTPMAHVCIAVRYTLLSLKGIFFTNLIQMN